MEQRMMYRTVISIAALASLAFAQPQWRVLPIRSKQEFEQGLPGGEGEQYPHSLSRSFYNPNHIYLGQDIGGAWRSKDGGATWFKCLDKGLLLPVCLGIAVDPANPDIAFITVDNSFNWTAVAAEGVYRTTDGGENWTRVLVVATNYSSSDHRRFQETIAHDPTTANSTTPASRWYAAIHNGGLYRSDNGGVSWSSSPVSSLVGHATVHVVRPHPTDARTVYVGTSRGLFRSDSLGRNLAPVGNLPAGEVTSVFVNPRNPAEVLAVVENMGLYRSTNSATTFVLVKAHNTAHVFVNPKYPSSMFLISLSGASYTTINAGTTWVTLPNATTFPGLGRESGWRRSWDGVFCAVVPNPSDSLEAVAHSRSTLFKTTDAGKTIRESATGWTGNAWGWYNSAIAFHPNDPRRIALFCYDVGMRLTLNGGNWFEENTNAQAWSWYQAGEIGWVGAYAGSFKPVAASRTIVEAIGNYWKTRIAITRDNGALWTLTGDTSDVALNLFVSYHPKDPAVVYAGGYLSADSGQTFTPVNFGGTYTRPEIVGMCHNYPDVIYAMDHDRSVLLRSRNRGATWSQYSRPGWQMRKMDPLPTFCADPSDTSVVYSIDASGDLARFDGVSWKSLGVLSVAGGPSWSYIRCVTVDPTHTNVIYAGMSGHGTAAVLRSVDTGNTWVDISYNLPRIGGGGLAVNPHTGELWKGSVAGTWILPPPYTSTGTRGASQIHGTAAQVQPRLVVIGVGRTLAEGEAAYDLRGRRELGSAGLPAGGIVFIEK